MHLPGHLGAGFPQRGDETLAVKVIVKDWLAPVATIHHMINRTGILDPQLPGHETGLNISRVGVKSGTDPFTGNGLVCAIEATVGLTVAKGFLRKNQMAAINSNKNMQRKSFSYFTISKRRKIKDNQ
jgi:hypothetical protein